VIWLLRSATPTTRVRTAPAGLALAALGVRLDACLCSPKIRALDTAGVVCGHLGLNPEPAEGLAGGDFDPGDLAAGRGEVPMVGHEPDFSHAIAQATGARVEMRKGGLAAIGEGTLITLRRPEQLEAIAHQA